MLMSISNTAWDVTADLCFVATALTSKNIITLNLLLDIISINKFKLVISVQNVHLLLLSDQATGHP